MTQDIRDLRPRGRLLENVAILRGTTRHDDEYQVHAWAEWIIKLIVIDGVSSASVLDEMRRAS